MLRNGAFSEGWTDMPPAPGNLINQQPKGWTLHWLDLGETLYGTSDVVTGIPECVHKLSNQLPANERLGEPNALILEGNATYKIFHFAGAFGAELKQTVSHLKPGTTATLTVPILAVLYDETDPYGAESGVWVNGGGAWVNGGAMGNRKWYRHKIEFTVPANGQATIVIRVKSKWPRKKDFFIDGIKLEAEAVRQSTSTPDPGETSTGGSAGSTGTATSPKKKVVVTVPAGMRVIKATSQEANTVVVIVPKGTKVKVKR